MFWILWGFCTGSLLTLWVHHLPNEREYERFLMLLGAKGKVLRTRMDAYADVQAGLANWRRRRYWRQMVAQQKRRPVRVKCPRRSPASSAGRSPPVRRHNRWCSRPRTSATRRRP